MTINKPGIYPDLAADLYHGPITPTPWMSSSLACAMSQRCPAAIWHTHPMLNPFFEQQNRREFDLGTAAHAFILEPQDAYGRMAVLAYKDYRTKAAQDARDAAYAEGKTPLLQHQIDQVTAMAAALERHPVAGSLIKGGIAEASHFWQDRKTGVWCKARPDYHTSNFLINYKTHGGSIRPDAFRRHVYDMGYWQRAAWELDAVEAADQRADYYAGRGCI